MASFLRDFSVYSIFVHEMKSLARTGKRNTLKKNSAEVKVEFLKCLNV